MRVLATLRLAPRQRVDRSRHELRTRPIPPPRTTATPSASGTTTIRGSRRRRILEGGQKALFQSRYSGQRLATSGPFEFEHFPGETHQGQLRIGLLLVDDHVLIVLTQSPLHLGRMSPRPFLLLGFPQLPLAQRVTQQDEHDLSGDGVEVPGVEIGQVVEAERSQSADNIEPLCIVARRWRITNPVPRTAG